MKGKLQQIISNWRVILVLFFVVLSLVSISPQIFKNDGVSIRGVLKNSSAADAGLQNPSAKLSPLQREEIISIDGKKVHSVEEYFRIVDSLPTNTTVPVETDKTTYLLLTRANILGEVDLGLRVYDTPASNLRKGLDLEGGTRVLLKPEEQISSEDFDSIVDNLKERLNIYGLSDVSVRAASDLSGERFILIEIAGATEDEVKDLLARQGKFEAKIGNETVFFGGKNDISYVCRSAQCSGIDPSRGCQRLEAEQYVCGFFFSITLSSEAAERQAGITKKLSVISEGGSSYLSEDLILFLDNAQVDQLKISSSLKGRAETGIQITGSGSGRTQAEAMNDALQNMKKLQTVIITGSLPVKLSIAKMDTISPTLGKEFLQNTLLVGVLAVIAVISVIFWRYRKAIIILPIALTLISEIIMILGFAAFIGWNLDLAAIAGIIIVAGTGVDSLIVITDETLRGGTAGDWKIKMKNAMFIVVGSYLTNISGMLPLLWAGAGLLKGFALTTIAGVSFGVLIARPAYAKVIELLLKE